MKTSFKKLTSIVLAVLMLLSVFAVSVSAADTDANSTGASTVYFAPGEADKDSPAWFAWTWGGVTDTWVTGVKDGEKISFIESEDKKTELLYNDAISKKIGVSTYLVKKGEKGASEYVKKENYIIEADKKAKTVTFGDLNNDGLINAQDALKIVNLWLRKTEVTGSDMIIAANVNGDSRINTYDALGIVDNFVKNLEYLVVNRAATIKETSANGQ